LKQPWGWVIATPYAMKISVFKNIMLLSIWTYELALAYETLFFDSGFSKAKHHQQRSKGYGDVVCKHWPLNLVRPIKSCCFD